MIRRLLPYLLTLVFVFGFMATVVSASATTSPQEPALPQVLLVDGNKSEWVETKASTVAGFLVMHSIKIGYFDTLKTPLNTPIEDGLKIEIDRAFDITLYLDGIEVSAESRNLTIAEFAKLYNSINGTKYQCYPDDAYVMIKPGMDVNLWYVNRVYDETTNQVIPYTTDYVYNASVNEGEKRVITPGVDGMAEVTTRYTYLQGELSETTVMNETVLTAPVTEVVEVGTAPTVGITEKYQYSEVITMEATAYTSDYASTGKRPGDKGFGITRSGMVAQYGVVAVDPNVIPLGTELYVDGYGYAIAGDTGGAIKGNKIDLYLNTSTEVKNFGRQKVTVYVLK